jgi:DNA-binding winged helix-turn-helix (wHTH) protein
MPTPIPPPIRFGIFEVDLSRRELRRRGTRIKLQGQPFDVLAALLEQPGAVVTREQLQARLWRDDTFVDFDRGLNKAINRVREALADTATTPRFIETLPRRGYRFIASIEVSAATAAAHVVRSSILPPHGAAFFAPHYALSKDGSRLAFVAADSTGRKSLWVRDLSAAEAQPMGNTEDARLPFWSPDGRRIGFFASRKLKVVDIAGGRVQAICDIRVAGGGGAWHADDLIVFAADAAGPLYRVSLSAGTPAPITPAPSETSSQLHCWPIFLPGTDRFLFFVNRSGVADLLSTGLYAGSLSSPEVHLISSEIQGNVAFASGRLVFAHEGALKAQSFDIQRLRLCGDTASIVQHEVSIWDRAFYHTGFSLSDSGLLVFQSRKDFAPELIWTDPSGKRSGQIVGGHWSPCISPDGRHVAFSSDELQNGRWFICVHDLVRCTRDGSTMMSSMDFQPGSTPVPPTHSG